MQFTRPFVSAAALLVLTAGMHSFGQDGDPFVGTYLVNPEKTSGLFPRNFTITIEASPDGKMRANIAGELKDGSKYERDNEFAYGEQDVQLEGGLSLIRTVEHPNSHTIFASFKDHTGAVVETLRLGLSEDENTLTQTISRLAADGTFVDQILVLDRQ
jgi:hypothetical protein